MSAKVKIQPFFSARLYDLQPGAHTHEGVGVEVMDVTIYLPEDRAYSLMKRRVISYRDGSGRAIAIMFTGVQLNLDDKNLRRLCGRLAMARRSLVAYVRNLAKA